MSDTDSDSDAELQQLISNPGFYKEIEKQRPLINNKPLLINCLEQLKNRLPWLERLDIVSGPALPPKDSGLDNDITKINPNDDFKREAFFYRQAQEAVLNAIPRLHDLGIPTRRPNDYFAEMVKTDVHMVKVREHIVVNRKRLELREKARQLREARKFGKQTQKNVLEARRVEKKKHMDALKANKKRPGGKDQAQFLNEYLGTNEKTKSIQNKSFDKNSNQSKVSFNRPKDVVSRRKINHKRAFKNQKYGNGGPKKRSKRNNSNSIRTGEREIRILSHKASSTKVNRLKKTMIKSKHKNVQRQKRKIASMK